MIECLIVSKYKFNKMMLIELYCVVDDFCKIFLSQWEAKLIETGQRKRIKDGNMSVS